MAKRKVKRAGPAIRGEDTALSTMPARATDALEGLAETGIDNLIKKQEKLQQFGEALVARRNKWVDARVASGVERRWIEDMDQYLGVDATSKRAASMMESAREGYPVTGRGETKATRSSVIVNITRTKTNAAEARLADMLLPTDDQNWSIKPTPVPELVKILDSDKALTHTVPGPNGEQPGTPIMTPQTDAAGNGMLDLQGQLLMRAMTEAEEARRQLELAVQACDAMALEISDQLEECLYNTEARAVIHQTCVLGTGVMKGPIVENKVRRAWMKGEDGTWIMQIVEEKKPSSEKVDVWHCFPDPNCGGNVKNGSGHWEVKHINEKQVRELAKQPKYNKDIIREVLLEGPQKGLSTLNKEHESREKVEAGNTAGDNVLYEFWEYWGSFGREDMETADVDLTGRDDLEQIDGCVILLNNRVVKAFINPLESGDIPYDYFVWEQSDGSPFGYGVPHTMKTPQRVLNAAWRQTMDNAGLGVGPQIVVKPSVITPANKQWEITGRKIWLCNDPNVDVRTAFHIAEFQMHLTELEALITLAMKFADEETSIPMLAQGEKGNAPDTVGGMTILMNSSNVVLRRLVKQFDDMITRPHITRYYEWNMLYSEKNGIKGDFNVDARGSSALLVKDMQNQALMQMGSYMTNGIISPMIHWDEWAREVLRANHIDVAKIMKTDAQIKQAQDDAAKNPQQTPQAAMAAAQVQVANIRAQAQVQKTKVDETVAQNKLTLQEDIAQQNQEAHLRDLALQKDIAMLTLSTKTGISLNEIRAQLAEKSAELTLQRELAAASNNLDRAKHFTPIPTVADGLTPPVEPPGKAPAGESFQA